MPRRDGTGPFGRQMHDLAPEKENSGLQQGRRPGAGAGKGMGRCDGTGRGQGRGLGCGGGRGQFGNPESAPAPSTPVRHPETGTYGGGRGVHQHRNICNTLKKTKP